MCTWGIGLPFDHPIWQSLPPCRCGDGNGFTTSDSWFSMGTEGTAPTVDPASPSPCCDQDESDEELDEPCGFHDYVDSQTTGEAERYLILYCRGCADVRVIDLYPSTHPEAGS